MGEEEGMFEGRGMRERQRDMTPKERAEGRRPGAQETTFSKAKASSKLESRTASLQSQRSASLCHLCLPYQTPWRHLDQ